MISFLSMILFSFLCTSMDILKLNKANFSFSIPPRFRIKFKGDTNQIKDIDSHYYCEMDQWSYRMTKKLHKAIKNTTEIDIEMIEALARKDYIPAIHLLGELYEIGYPPLKKNFTAAFEYFSESAKAGYVESYSSLAFYYKYGFGDIVPDQTYTTIYNKLASDGKSIRGMLTEALGLTTGLTKPKSYRSASEILLQVANGVCQCYEKSKLNNNLEPQRFKPGFHISQPQSHEKSTFELLKYRSKQGDKTAKFQEGVVYYNGQFGQEVDYEKAKEIFEEMGEDPRAQAMIARMHHFGHGVEKDIDKARDYYAKALPAEDVNALAGYAILELNEDNDPVAAANLFKQAAAKGHDGAYFNYAMLKVTGKGGEKNVTDAYRKFKELTHKGFLLAYVNAASFLLTGNVKFNERRAVKYLWRVINRGPWNKLSEFAETAYLSGNYELALQIWLELGDMGIEAAAYNAGLMLLHWKVFSDQPFFNFDEERTLEIAAEQFKSSFFLGFTESAQYVAQCYFLLNISYKGIKWLKRCNNSASLYHLAMIEIEDEEYQEDLVGIYELLKQSYNGSKNLIPIAYAFSRYFPLYIKAAYTCCTNECDQEYVDGMVEIAKEVFSKNFFLIMICSNLFLIILLLRCRVKYLYYQTNE